MQSLLLLPLLLLLQGLTLCYAMLALRHFFPAVTVAAGQTGTDPMLCYAYAMLMLMLALRRFVGLKLAQVGVKLA